MAPMPPFSHPNAASVSLDSNVPRTPQTILVTGGAGFIGFHTCMQLLERGDSVIVIDEVNDYYDVELKKDNLETLRSFAPSRVHIVIGDLCDQTLVRNTIKQYQPTSIIHLAARAGVRPSINDPLLYIHSNIQASTVLLEACRQFNIKRFVYASSSSVYGGSKKEFFSEQDVVDFPVSPYAATKKACELLAHTYYHLYGIECFGLRFFTVYGPRGRPDMAPFKFMHRIANDVTIEQYGDGNTSRDYTYIDDIVQGVIKSHDLASGCEVFNLGNGNPVFLKDFIQIIEQNVGKKASIKILPEQPGDVPRTCADITKAKSMLGYCPTTPLDQGLEKTWKWYAQYYQK